MGRKIVAVAVLLVISVNMVSRTHRRKTEAAAGKSFIPTICSPIHTDRPDSYTW